MLGRRPLLGGIASIAVGIAASPPANSLPVRRDAASLAQSPHMLACLEAAIGEMQQRSERDPHDPKGWSANIDAHHAVCAAVANDDAQVHGCWWFLPWHRAFLAVTEWKLRAISGDPSLALPYWNWSSDRTIPAAFAIPTSLLARAARYTPNRPLTSVEVDHLLHDGDLARLGVAALGARAFQAWAPEQIPRTFGGIAKPNAGQWHGRNRLEGIPHTAVHNYIGGEATNGSLGDMTQLSTAATICCSTRITRTSTGCGRIGAAIRCGTRASHRLALSWNSGFHSPGSTGRSLRCPSPTRWILGGSAIRTTDSRYFATPH
jgi:hypothetical protein